MKAKKLIILLSFLGVIVILDQLTKFYIYSDFSVGESVKVLKDFFDITYVRNTGAAFGFLGDQPEMFRKIFFLSITPVALFFILGMMKSTPERDTLQHVGLSLIFSGAVGNYIDRVRFGYVVDFLDFYIPNLGHYPAFNVADISIVCGVMILITIIITEMMGKRTPIVD